MKEKLDELRLKLAERLHDAEQDAYYSRSSSEHDHHITRAEEIKWFYGEILRILGESPVDPVVNKEE